MSKDKKYPDGTKFNDYCIVKERQRDSVVPTIRRWITLPDGKKKLERYPTEKYKDIRDNERELKDLVIRLNEQIPAEKRTKEAVEIKHAFIGPKMLDDYLVHLLAIIPTESVARTEWYYLKSYFLNYFISKLNLSNPSDWYKHQDEWAHSLRSLDDKLWKKGELKSAKLIKDTVISANRFIAWLHERKPDIPLMIFKPISKAVYKDIKSKRRSEGIAGDGQYIYDSDWAKIKEKLPDNLRPFILLAYYYGLRRNEILGLKLEDVRSGHLYLERQLLAYSKKKVPKYGPPKGKKPRAIPHWNCRPEEAYRLIEEGQNLLMNPTNFGKAVSAFMKSIGMLYSSHDIRHTWITKMVKVHHPEKVRKAAGHEDLTVTMGYIHEGELMDGNEIFVPGKAS